MAESSLPTPALVLIGLGFGAVAVWTATDLVVAIRYAVEFRDAVVVNATLHQAKRYFAESGDGHIERMSVRYTYEFDGIPYENETEHICLFARSQPLHDTLEETFQARKPIGCYVDPDDPSQSFLCTRFSVPLFLATSLFPVFFGAVPIIAVRELRRRRRRHST